MSKVPLMQYADAFGIIQPTFPSWTVHPLLMLGSMVEESVEACEVAHTSNKKMSSQHSSDFRTGQRRCLAFTPTRKSSSQRTCMECTTSRTKHRADGRLLQQLSLSSSDSGAVPGSRRRVFPPEPASKAVQRRSDEPYKTGTRNVLLPTHGSLEWTGGSLKTFLLFS
jgi:hypothetical protein